ncbi:polyprenyl synthetase family protein [bacterium]|nr:polyprenyl synthetase family protein [candidate division CSSED10-310 bacterium]
MISFDRLNAYLIETGELLRDRIPKIPFVQQLGAGPIKERLLDYVMRGGKNLRPALTRMACGAVGGDPDHTLSVGMAIEMTHTWTLVHDDIIDRDDSRRGGLSVHAQIRQDYAQWELTNPGMTVDHLAHSMAILVGDAQHAMAMEILSDSALRGPLLPELALYLISELEGKVLPALLTGEVDDVFLTGCSLESITPDDIMVMLRRKTAALLTFSVVAGGMIGLMRPDPYHPSIQALRTYGDALGVAFQLRDDILGIQGDEGKLGKPVGSDFKEGKRTLAMKMAWDHANASQRLLIDSLLGKKDMSAEDIASLRSLIETLGAVEAVNEQAETLVQSARNALDALPDTPARDLLSDVAEYAVIRQK